MSWIKKSKGGGNYLRFEAGTAHEGILKGITERPSPFTPGVTLQDYLLEINGEEKILSSASAALKSILPITPLGTKIRIEMSSKGGRKMYDVFMEE